MLFILFSFSICLELVVDKTNVDKLQSDSYKIPVFILFYSPYCGHCQKVHPVWEQLMSNFKDDNEIIVAEVNIYTNRAASNKILSVSAVPTFASYIDGKATAIRVTRTLQEFTKTVNEIKENFKKTHHKDNNNINNDNNSDDVLNISCNYWNENTNFKYPILTVQAGKNNSNDELQACKEIMNLHKLTGIELDYFFINSTNGDVNNRDIYIWNNPFVSVKYEPDKFNSVASYIIEYFKYKSFGSWSFFNQEDFDFISKNTHRKMALFFLEDPDLEQKVILKFRSVALNYSDKYLFNHFSLSQIRNHEALYSQLEKVSTQGKISLLISNSDRSIFFLIKEIDREDIHKYLDFFAVNEQPDNSSFPNIIEQIQVSLFEKIHISIDESKSIKTTTQDYIIVTLLLVIICLVLFVMFLLLIIIKLKKRVRDDNKTLIRHEQDDQIIEDYENENENSDIIKI